MKETGEEVERRDFRWEITKEKIVEEEVEEDREFLCSHGTAEEGFKKMLVAQLATKKVEEEETQQVLKEKEEEEMKTNIKKALEENKANVLQIAVEVAQKRQAARQEAEDEEEITLKLMLARPRSWRRRITNSK